ncbi:MAG TPA: cache domain-containing protein, partial [Fibrobacteraceae bacterium]|nr:cache domain-containing protein [Fibrobacteraceae bacterium]
MLAKWWSSWSLARKINTTLLITVSAIFVCFALIAIGQVRSEMLASERDNLENNTKHIAKSLDWWIGQIWQDLEMHMADPVWSEKITAGQIESLIPKLKTIQSKNNAYENVFITSSDGKLLVGARDGSKGINVSNLEFWRGIQEGRPMVQDFYPYKSPVSGDPVFVVAAPILNVDGHRIGVLCISVDLSIYANKFITNRVFGKEGYPYVMTD